jgi:diadenosine tetraphosphate (Ap4A) HIT family hydrolase
MEERFERYHPNINALHRDFQTQPCFVCEVVADTNELPQHIVYEDDEVIAFLDAYPRQYGYTLVAPKEHREQVTGDFTINEYLNLQRLIYQVSEAVRRGVDAERMYIFTFGSNEGISHVHWHVAPLLPGVPYDGQQGQAVSWKAGVLKIPQEEMASLATRIGRRVNQLNET